MMACISASGDALPPFIIFAGQRVQVSWRPSITENKELFPWIWANTSG